MREEEENEMKKSRQKHPPKDFTNHGDESNAIAEPEIVEANGERKGPHAPQNRIAHHGNIVQLENGKRQLKGPKKEERIYSSICP